MKIRKRNGCTFVKLIGARNLGQSVTHARHELKKEKKVIKDLI